MLSVIKTLTFQTIAIGGILVAIALISTTGTAHAQSQAFYGDNAFTNFAQYYCGGKGQEVNTYIDFGCKHVGNPITDGLFAIIRFLSAGVGLVIIGSIVYGGIMYTTSRGDPQATAKAIARIRSAITALLIFIFAYALLGYLIPQGFLP